jgi:uncharacterized protein (DUF2225 family)
MVAKPVRVSFWVIYFYSFSLFESDFAIVICPSCNFNKFFDAFIKIYIGMSCPGIALQQTIQHDRKKA